MSRSEQSDDNAWAGQPVAQTVSDAHPRRRVVATGTILSASTVVVGSGPAYRCTLHDGTGELDLVFLGRSSVPGLVVGARCSAEGTVLVRGARLTLWNPLYRLGLVEGPLTSDGGSTSPIDEAQPADGAPMPRARVAPGASRAPGDKLERADEGAELVEPTGHFRIYLGAAAGVGKTVAMLDEGQRRRERGTDVVIGFVESHGRPVTQAHTKGFEVVPRRKVAYRGATFEEMDTEAVLARRPAVVLVDELAHTNVPGSGRHDKRWQDVLELLEAGIDVITTVNIQHLESIADAVERITRVQVRERVPDWVVRRADQVELVDSSPEQLRRRMLHGNIYPPEKVTQALTHFFRVDNLTALRELALRFLADETEEELLAHLERHETGVLWETAERIMVGVTAARGTDAIIRRASRIAARVKADLHVVHVAGGDTVRRAEGDELAQLRQIAADVGATWHEIELEDPVAALLDFARRHQITQIVIGSSQRSRWQELAGGGSVVRRVTRRAAELDVDVHIIARRRPLKDRDGRVDAMVTAGVSDDEGP